MNNDYLWDKTGEPDAQVQQLEEVLSVLRYQPQPLQLPASVRQASKRRFSPLLAIAAAVALMLLAGGLWIAFRQERAAKPMQARQQEPKTNHSEPSGAPDHQLPVSNQPKDNEQAGIKPPHHRGHGNFANLAVRRKDRPATSTLSAAELAKAQAAKDQLMLALRVASAKLNLAQRRTQSPIPNYIRNQHKVG